MFEDALQARIDLRNSYYARLTKDITLTSPRVFVSYFDPYDLTLAPSLPGSFDSRLCSPIDDRMFLPNLFSLLAMSQCKDALLILRDKCLLPNPPVCKYIK